jgi:hypothetical protein
MKKQVLRALTMLSLVATLIVVGVVAPAAGQTFNQIRVDVPFEFSDGTSVFAAGKYRIRPIGANTNAAISITSEDGKAYGLRMCFNAEVTSPKNETTLVFHRYGDRYFLSQIWTAGETNGLQLPRSSMERGLQRAIETSSGQSAAASGPAIVTIAAGLPAAQ